MHRSITDTEPQHVDGFVFPRADAPEAQSVARRQRARAVTAGGFGLLGLGNFASAIWPNVSDRVERIRSATPLVANDHRFFVPLLAGIGLTVFARGLRRGQRLAWATAIVMFALAAYANTRAHGNPFNTGVSVIGIAGLVLARHSFAVETAIGHVRKTVIVTACTGMAVCVAVMFAIELTSRSGGRLPLGTAFQIARRRALGLSAVGIPHVLSVVIYPVITATCIVAIIAIGWAITSASPGETTTASDLARARDLVRRYGGGTLDYFALRADKQFFFWGDTVVPFAVFGGTALVSPDPLGPIGQRAVAWQAFLHHADRHGWTVAVLGAGNELVSTYREHGHHVIYIGDEAVVPTLTLSLEGGKHKSLRQAVARMANKGYRVEFFDPASVPDDLRTELESLIDQSRRGKVERGYSMMLGRLFAPADPDMLLAVAFAPDQRAVAFCHYVPAPAANGYSLDIMRREKDTHPNGLFDFIIVETVRHLAEQGRSSLSLNFAGGREILAADNQGGIISEAYRRVFVILDRYIQINTLHHFTSKFDPEWQPRYLVFDSIDHLPAVGLAVAQAEGLTELPVIGPLLRPHRAPRLETLSDDIDGAGSVFLR